MNTIKRRILSLTLALVAAAMLCACKDDKGANVQVKLRENSDTFVVIEATADGGSLADALKALKADGQLEYESTWSAEYGEYITSVNGHAADATANEFWAVYTTLTERDGATYSYAEYGNEYDGKMLYSASVGASGLPLYKGELYMLVFERANW